MAVNRRRLLDRYFYFGMSLLIAVVVASGFGRTANAKLLHPPSPRPFILYLHAIVFTSWVIFFMAQSALIRVRNVRLHRKLGWFGLGLGIAIPVLGVATAITMARFNTQHGSKDEAHFVVIPLFDIVAFSVTFGLAFYWRRKPEFHRRLILIASCGLTAAAFARFPNWLVPDNCMYVAVDTLILLGVARDLIVTKHVHPIYLYGLAGLALGQALAVYTFLGGSHAWVTFAHALIR